MNALSVGLPGRETSSSPRSGTWWDDGNQFRAMAPDRALDQTIRGRVAGEGTQLRPQVTAEFEKIYGDRLKEHMDEVEREVWQRAFTSVKLGEIMEALKVTYPPMRQEAYAHYMLVVVNEGWIRKGGNEGAAPSAGSGG